MAYEVVFLGGGTSRECLVQLTSVVLQVNRVNRWVWTLHASNCYTVGFAYSYLTDADNNNQQHNNQFLWLQEVPLKVSIFAWRLFLNRVPTRDKLLQRRALTIDEQGCVANCGSNEDKDHLFINCVFFGGLWPLIAGWLGFSTAFHDFFY